MIEIKPVDVSKKPAMTVRVPGSKSHTHRSLIASALSDGICRIKNGLDSEDIGHTKACLRQFGVGIKEDGDVVTVHGTGGAWRRVDDPIYLGNSGTSIRLLAGVAAIGDGTYILDGNHRMRRRPIQPLVDSLRQAGVMARCLNNDGCPPVEIQGRRIKGGRIDADGRLSSQFISSLCFIAPFTDRGLDIHVMPGLVSRPYLDMTIETLRRFGIETRRSGYRRFHIPGKQNYRPGDHVVEPDCSQASYFWAAGAITGARVTALGTGKETLQGDVKIVELMRRMGCRVDYGSDGISVQGGELTGIDADMGDMPDAVPTLAVVAAFAQGKTTLRNIAHLKAKESDRLEATAAELRKMGISANAGNDGLAIFGGAPKGAEIETYDDHRMAMSFGVAGLRVPGMRILNEMCVSKSFPHFWTTLRSMARD